MCGDVHAQPLDAAGVDIKTVPAWLGHPSAKLTHTYGHLMGTDADRAAVDRVNRAFAQQRANLRQTWAARALFAELETPSK